MNAPVASDGVDQKDHGRVITVTVNHQPVTFRDERVSGLEIKQAAIEQQVHIQLDFNLFAVKKHGEPLQQIGDQEKVELHEGEEFRATSPDDNS